MLLQRLDVNPNTANQDGETLPFLASNKRDEGAAGEGRRPPQYCKQKWYNAILDRGPEGT